MTPVIKLAFTVHEGMRNGLDCLFIRVKVVHNGINEVERHITLNPIQTSCSHKGNGLANISLLAPVGHKPVKNPSTHLYMTSLGEDKPCLV